MEPQVKCFGPMVQITEDRCTWSPTMTTRGRVSAMFYSTTCGKDRAALLKDSGWSHCPFCGEPLWLSFSGQS
jgi:hypothetical protein